MNNLETKKQLLKSIIELLTKIGWPIDNSFIDKYEQIPKEFRVKDDILAVYFEDRKGEGTVRIYTSEDELKSFYNNTKVFKDDLDNASK